MAKIVAIRIRGRVDLHPRVRRALDQLRLKKKFACSVVDDKPEILGMLKRVQDHIAYGPINEETLKELIVKRGRLPGNKPLKKTGAEIDKFIKEFVGGKKKLEDIGIKPFFLLHPPRGGFKKKRKIHFPKGVLGKNDKVNELLKRML